MSDHRIAELSNSILVCAIDEWNRVVSLGSNVPSRQQSLLDLIHQTRTRIPELHELQKETSPRADGQEGLLSWLIWLDEILGQTRLSQPSKSSLRKSIERAISLLSTSTSVHQAIEAASRRQVYELAYGLTHEINNPLGNIVARAQQLLSKSTVPYDRKSLATIVDQAMKAHEMLAEVMRAVQPRQVELTQVELVYLVREAFDKLMPIAQAKNLTWQWKEGPTPIWAQLNDSGVSEALRLIAQNAIDACTENDSIRWAVDELGSTVRIQIEDTGPGLSPYSLRRAFDLFYSGREAGRGLGVSLAVVRRLVSESQGRIAMSSDRQLGCRVELRFKTTRQRTNNEGSVDHRKPWKL
jgi:signal transduction histidine kinase